MPSTVQPVSRNAENAPLLLVFDDEGRDGQDVIDSLSDHGYRTARVSLSPDGLAAFLRERPGVAILADRAGVSSNGASVRARAAELGIPVLAVVDDGFDSEELADRLSEVDDWVTRRGLRSELPARVARLLKTRTKTSPEGIASSFPVDSQFFALVVHDLRTPLNVIGLSLRMIGQAIPKGDPELDEDLRFVEENYRQIERMLSQLSDYYRLFETESSYSSVEFSPARLLDELLEMRATKAGSKVSRVQVDLTGCPPVVSLDPSRARQAIQYALINATAAANGEPIRLAMRGGPDRWVIELAVDTPAPASVQAVALTSQAFERLCGIAAERRGMDLAITAKVTEAFGGTARLDVNGNRGTSIVLDWPVRLPS